MPPQQPGTLSAGTRAVFLDRDGTIIEEKHYLSSPDGVVLLPTAAETIARLNGLGIPVIIVTNQAGIARGYFAETCLAPIHARIDALLTPGNARIDRYEYCPHHPTEGVGVYRIDCDCRKPKAGMLTRAAAALGLDLNRSLMIGDRPGDVHAGLSAGCHAALVRTGYGAGVAHDEIAGPRLLGIYDTLGAAVEDWLQIDLEQNLPVH